MKKEKPIDSIFPLLKQYPAKLISVELVSVQPMAMPSSSLLYWDFNYEKWNDWHNLKSFIKVLK